MHFWFRYNILGPSLNCYIQDCDIMTHAISSNPYTSFKLAIFSFVNNQLFPLELFGTWTQLFVTNFCPQTV